MLHENMMSNQNMFELMRTAEQLSNEMVIRWTRSFTRNLGISPILVLHELKEKGPQKPSDLAAALGYTPGALTNIANRLMKSAYVKRQHDEQDRRVVRLEITEEGKNCLLEANEKGQKLRRELFEQLEEEEIIQFLRIQQKMLSILQSTN